MNFRKFKFQFLYGMTAFLLIAAVSIMNACTGDKDSSSDNPSKSELTGVVLDLEDDAIGDVNIACGGLSATSADDGTFSLILAIEPDHLITFTRNGYVDTIKKVDIKQNRQNTVTVRMAPEAIPLKLNALLGGTVNGERNASLTAGAGVFVDSSGTPVTGEVDVYLTPLDPSIQNEALAYPGQLSALDLNGHEVRLETYGIMDVTVRLGGEKLQIAEGSSVDISLPAPSGIDTRPDTINMWYFDMENCIWVQHDNDGTYDPGTGTYAATISHLSWENCDDPSTPTCIHGKVVDSSGNGVGGAYMTAQIYNDLGMSGGIYSYRHTDLYGNYCMTIEQDERALLTIYYNETITTRVVTGGMIVSSNDGADCAEESCKHIRSIEIGTPDPGENAEADCDIGSYDDNPFWGTCAQALGEFYGCFSPEGGCSFVIDPGFLGGMPSYEMTFDNGARIESDYNIFTGGLDFEYYGPMGTLCGTVAYNESGAMTYRFADNEEIVIRITESGAMEIECPGGFTFTMDAAQEDALIGCTGQSGNSDSGVACEAEEGSFLSECAFDTECNEGYECCGLTGEKMCLSSSMCSAYEQYACSSNPDCNPWGYDWVCCYNGYFNMCMPASACQSQ
ncbi:MAG TPA: hypothetical protein PK859_16485 [Spirochaetota bacterium]|nr:hypothetical protein [Spirochaetota bacterium]